ncbi:hypothetical protein MUK42_16942 [Musa troglodytarum]|uniref:Uncharacterized protein n=1 Tax=Musa troglodytarum TaxID=320322 RepID=A0A9E7KNJ7_9LILI|nr:hypothetical protein MUK42_16942 [Musa troglodytarum]
MASTSPFLHARSGLLSGALPAVLDSEGRMTPSLLPTWNAPRA